MAIAYERFEGEVLADEDDIISSSSEDTQSLESQGRLVLRGHAHNEGQQEPSDRMQQILQNKWPQKVGILHIAWGIILLLLGLAQIVVVPLIEDTHSDFWTPRLYRGNDYGVTLWTSLMLLLSGTLGVRAAIYRSTCCLYSFVTVIIIQILIFPCLLVYILVGYSSGWTTRSAYPADSVEFQITTACAVGVMLGFAFSLLAFTQYYDEVFCGELQLCRRCVHFCFPCWCPRAVHPDELLEDNPDRPPSLPV